MTKSQTAELVTFGIGFVVLFVTLRHIMFWSMLATGWLYARVCDLIPQADVEGVKTKVWFVALLFVFAGMAAVAHSVKFAVHRCCGLKRPTHG